MPVAGPFPSSGLLPGEVEPAEYLVPDPEQRPLAALAEFQL